MGEDCLVCVIDLGDEIITIKEFDIIPTGNQWERIPECTDINLVLSIFKVFEFVVTIICWDDKDIVSFASITTVYPGSTGQDVIAFTTFKTIFSGIS